MAGKKTAKSAELDFSEFEMWRRDAVEDPWPKEWPSLTKQQKEIVNFNVGLLADKKKFDAQAAKFERELAKITDEDARAEKRAEFVINLQAHHFVESLNLFSWEIPCEITFDQCSFEKGLSLHNATVKGTVRLASATVTGDVSLDSATVTGDVWLDSAEVKGNVLLDSATVTGDVWLHDLKCGDSTTLSASDMVVAGSLFVQSSFFKSFNMQRAQVDGTASFAGCEFAQIPDFRDAKFDRPPEVANMVVPGPVMHGGRLPGLKRLFKTAFNPNDVLKFRKLKAMALEANDHEKDGEFFAKDMLAKRGHETDTFGALFFNSIYWGLSNFGQSFTRPLAGLLINFFCFALLNIAYLIQATGNWDHWWFGAELALRNGLSILGTLFRFAVRPEGHEGWFIGAYDDAIQAGASGDVLVYIGIFEQLFSSVLLFLFLLALRNKFRLK